MLAFVPVAFTVYRPLKPRLRWAMQCLVLQLSLEVRRRAVVALFPVTDLGEGLMQASPQ